jgi:CRISPR-associated endonuclease/helicase Cas3
MNKSLRVTAEKPKQKQFYGHSIKDKGKPEWQLLRDHLTNTANIAEGFGLDLEISNLAYIAGLLHDIGKYSEAFQKRLDGSPNKPDHATAGARLAVEIFNNTDTEKWLATIVAYCVSGHHTGLPDYGSVISLESDGTLISRIDPEKKLLEDFSSYKSEIDLSSLKLKSRTIKTTSADQGFSIAFLTRMLFSTLVDADFQDTETFIQGSARPRGGYDSINKLREKFSKHIQQFVTRSNEINKKRSETLSACIGKAENEQGFFTLTIPTGGGKTLSSMGFALNHAVKHGLKRIIYVIPFTSIIEQNAGVFKGILGEENVLEHHSNFDWSQKHDETLPDDETKDVLGKLKLAAENWDIPVVVTTNVQFFESLFSNRSSQCRKLHNLTKSVIIFDEAQMLPMEYMKPCMGALKELVRNYGVTTIFCTATQPSLGRFLDNVSFTELAPNPQALFNFYKRVNIKNLGCISDATLIERIHEFPQAVCIVNTRKHAKGLYDQLGQTGRFHLSTLMCPTHRKETLLKIRELLKAGEPCRVISTQIMEAGIDVDFPVGFRAIAGLDSIIQAAGRVNREMRLGMSDVYVFDPQTEFIKKTPSYIKQGATITESILRKYGENPDSVQAIEEYFNKLYHLQGANAFDIKGILAHFNKGGNELDFDFKTAAEKFKLIENTTVAVVIPYNEEATECLEQARHHPFPFKFSRTLQMYTVNIYENEFKALKSKGVIETYNETFEVLTKSIYYNEQTGLVLPPDNGGDALFID